MSDVDAPSDAKDVILVLGASRATRQRVVEGSFFNTPLSTLLLASLQYLTLYTLLFRCYWC